LKTLPGVRGALRVQPEMAANPLNLIRLVPAKEGNCLKHRHASRRRFSAVGVFLCMTVLM